MTHRGSKRGRVLVTVVCMVVVCSAIPIANLLDRASKHSDKLHSLSTTITQELDSHFPLIGQVTMPRPSVCHTSSLQTPNDKDQALQVSESDLMSLVRSLLQAWAEPLSVMSANANVLPRPSQVSISNKIQELREDSKNLGDGLDILSGRMGPAAQIISLLPYRGSTDLGTDKITKLINFNFLLSCLRRDSHKIDSFLKVLRCRAAKMHPDMC